MTVRIGKTTKTFRLVIGTGANRKRFTLGEYPTLSLAAAREKAQDIIAKKRLHPTETARTTFSEALETYYRVSLSTLRPRTQMLMRRVLDRHLQLHLGDRVLDEIKRREIAPIVDTMADTPTIKHTAFSYLSTFLNWAVKRGYIDSAPPTRMEAPRRAESRDRVLAPAKLVAIWQAAPDDDYGRIVRLLILSG